jgi:hypothetical protein
MRIFFGVFQKEFWSPFASVIPTFIRAVPMWYATVLC